MRYLLYLPLQLLIEVDYALRFFHLKPDRLYWADSLLAKWGFLKRLCLFMKILWLIKRVKRMKIFFTKTDNIYLNPVFTLSTRHRIVALIWLKYNIGLLY